MFCEYNQVRLNDSSYLIMLTHIRLKKFDRRKSSHIKTLLAMEELKSEDIFCRLNMGFDKAGTFCGEEVPTTILCFLNGGMTCQNGKVYLTDFADVISKEPGVVDLHMKLGRVHSFK